MTDVKNTDDLSDAVIHGGSAASLLGLYRSPSLGGSVLARVSMELKSRGINPATGFPLQAAAGDAVTPVGDPSPPKRRSWGCPR